MITITPAVMLFGMRLAALYQSMIAIVPGAGFASADPATKAVAVVYPPTATQVQKDQVASLIAGFDWTQAGQIAWDDAQRPDFAAIRTQATAAIQTNNAYMAIADTAVATDVRAQMKAVTQQNTQLIKTLGAVILSLTGR